MHPHLTFRLEDIVLNMWFWSEARLVVFDKELICKQWDASCIVNSQIWSSTVSYIICYPVCFLHTLQWRGDAEGKQGSGGGVGEGKVVGGGGGILSE